MSDVVQGRSDVGRSHSSRNDRDVCVVTWWSRDVEVNASLVKILGRRGYDWYPWPHGVVTTTVLWGISRRSVVVVVVAMGAAVVARSLTVVPAVAVWLVDQSTSPVVVVLWRRGAVVRLGVKSTT